METKKDKGEFNKMKKFQIKNYEQQYTQEYSFPIKNGTLIVNVKFTNWIPKGPASFLERIRHGGDNSYKNVKFTISEPIYDSKGFTNYESRLEINKVFPTKDFNNVLSQIFGTLFQEIPSMLENTPKNGTLTLTSNIGKGLINLSKDFKSKDNTNITNLFTVTLIVDNEGPAYCIVFNRVKGTKTNRVSLSFDTKEELLSFATSIKGCFEEFERTAKTLPTE